jgi:molecular chaperone Hsp33
MSVPMTDSLTRFVFERAALRGAVVGLDSAYRQCVGHHLYPPRLKRLIGETMAAMCLLANSLKFEGSLVLQLQASGALRLLVVECDASLSMRATAQWNGEIAESATLGELAGDPKRSRMVLTLDPKDGGPLHQGIVALEGGSVASLFEHYLGTSEQIASRLWLEADDEQVRGLLLQRMPASTEADAATWERAVSAVDKAQQRFAPTDAHALLHLLFLDDDVRAFRARVPRFACSCTRERVAGALKMLGSAEVESILAEQGSIGVNCEFCNRRYDFDAIAARALFAEPRAAVAHQLPS